MPAQQVVAIQVGVADDLVAQRGGQVFAQPAADLVAERALVSGVVEIHTLLIG